MGGRDRHCISAKVRQAGRDLDKALRTDMRSLRGDQGTWVSLDWYWLLNAEKGWLSFTSQGQTTKKESQLSGKGGSGVDTSEVRCCRMVWGKRSSRWVLLQATVLGDMT